MKNMLYIPALLAAGTVLAAGDAITFPYPGDWNDNPLVSEAKDGALLFSGDHGMIASTRIFRIDPSRTYRLSGSFRQEGAAKVKMTLALRVYDRDRIEIKADAVSPVPGTDTKLSADCCAADKFVIVENGSAIRRGSLAFHTEPDFSDLPNRRLIPGIQTGTKLDDGKWRIEFRQPVGVNLPAGTAVRAHYGYLYQMTGGQFNITENWTEHSGTVSGMAKSGRGGSQWRPGAAYAQVILVKEGKNAKVLFQNIKWEEIPAPGTGK
ncbi:MAG: hypothetical protein BWY31_01756 [Lentisphaerae bacterium ADurb.Bin242]|nr:MAG: hypothetical protein BWY31_01756 [Lentisphaerae bacterium ADurb.Bin242]